jgi:hypothetical protein
MAMVVRIPNQRGLSDVCARFGWGINLRHCAHGVRAHTANFALIFQAARWETQFKKEICRVFRGIDDGQRARIDTAMVGAGFFGRE